LAGAAAGAYAVWAGVAWLRYGNAKPPSTEYADPLLDRFMPEYEVVERQHIRVLAPADVTLAAAYEMDLGKSAIVRAIFRAREFALGAKPAEPAGLTGLVALTKSLGWGVLAEVPGREIVMGAVTRPWEADIVFRAIPPDQFAAFHEPGYVKIVWTLRADPVGPAESIHRTETRVATTDDLARAKFRRYWAAFSPGIVVIRRIGLALVRDEAERAALQPSALREITRSRLEHASKPE
jgi:hypothetical protein